MSAVPGVNYWTCRKISPRAHFLNVRDRQDGAAAMTGHTVEHAGVVGVADLTLSLRPPVSAKPSNDSAM